MRRRLALLVASLVAAACVAVAPAAEAAPIRVVVYGDSLSTEATPYLMDVVARTTGGTALVRGAPGGATCDLFDLMRHDARHLRPAVVVVQFSGNNLTRCMQGGDGRALTGDAWLAKYRADTARAVGFLRPMGAPIFLATSPHSLLADKQGQPEPHRLNQLYREIAGRHADVHVVEAARAVLAAGRHWTLTMPCLPKEPCTQVDTNAQRANQVRAPDGAHFCPTPKASPTADCPVWSSGALRFALGLVVQPLQFARLYDHGRFQATVGAGWRPA